MSEFRAPPAGSGAPHCSAARERSAQGQVSPAIGAEYSEIEHLLAGEACTFEGPATGPADVATVGNGYTTRLIVRRPTDPTRFSGRVLIEPFNTSGGPDRDIVWSLVGSLLQTNGDAWIGITHRTSSVKHLQEYDAERYVDLDISSNDLAWDVLRQLAELVRRGGGQSPLGDLDVSHVYLAGYSQSAADIATFAMSIGPIARTASGSPLFDGYFPAGSSGSLTPLASGRTRLPRFEAGPIGQVDVPVIQTETQTDVEGFEAVLSSGTVHTNSGSANHRRDDSDAPDQRYRLYELAGAPHQNSRVGCDGVGSSFPTSAFVRAALVHLFRWAEQGVAPPRAARIDLATFDTVSESTVDEYGNAVGGVRSPFIDVPIARFEVHSGPGALCKLVGRETTLPADVLLARYGDAQSFVSQFSSSLDATIAGGFLLEMDRGPILDAASSRAAGVFSSIQG